MDPLLPAVGFFAALIGAALSGVVVVLVLSLPAGFGSGFGSSQTTFGFVAEWSLFLRCSVGRAFFFAHSNSSSTQAIAVAAAIMIAAGTGVLAVGCVTAPSPTHIAPFEIHTSVSFPVNPISHSTAVLSSRGLATHRISLPSSLVASHHQQARLGGSVSREGGEPKTRLGSQ
jgi:hypothetical protein